MRRLAVLAVAVASLTSGCTTVGQDVPPTGTEQDAPMPEDSGLRPVSLPYGDSLPYLAPETSAQAICQALPARRWRELLDGAVGRTIYDRSTCVVTGEDVTVKLRMRELVLDPDAEVVTIAGHQVRIGEQQAATALLPVGEQDAEAQLLSRTLPVFHAEGPDEILRDVFAALLPVLVNDGPPVPAPGADGEVPYTPTAPVAGVVLVDLPAPVRGLVLCTAVLAATGAPADQVHIGANGSCDVGETSAMFHPDFEVGTPDRSVAGRPATVDDNKVSVEVNRGVLSIRREVADLAFAAQLIGALGQV